MSYYIYIAANTDDNELYKGFSEDPHKRIEEHNAGTSQFTSTKQGWYLVFVQEFLEKRDALIFEKKIKRLNRASLNRLITSEDNLLRQ
jgi:putative endonuclease